MQLFFLLCTMLITTSEAFSRGVRRSTSFKRKTFPYPLSRYMFRDLSAGPFNIDTSQYEAPNPCLRNFRNRFFTRPIFKSGRNLRLRKRHQCSRVPFHPKIRGKLIRLLKKKHKRFSNCKCLSERDTKVSATNESSVSGNDTQKYDISVYDATHPEELSLLEGDYVVPKVMTKEEASESDGWKESLAEDISKLKHMISDMESALREKRKKSFVQPGEGSKEVMKNVTEKIATNGTLDDTQLKEKIDKLAIPVLTQISEDLAKKNITITTVNGTVATSASSANASSGSNTSLSERCNPDGTWVSTAMKLDLTLNMQSNMMIKITVKPSKVSELNDKWSMQGLTLSKYGGPFIFAGMYPQKKKVISFLGQCKISKQEDFIFGIWTTFSFSRKYTDLWKSVETKLDVLTKKESISRKKKSKKKEKHKREKKKRM